LEATRVNNKRFENVEGVDGTLTLVEANCEAMPFPDNSFDAVTNVYLFHEMPKGSAAKRGERIRARVKAGG
jgi:ubiquinone/menaquinone biosynthesis C-methylase UbiE